MKHRTWILAGATAMFAAAGVAQNLIVDPSRPPAHAIATRNEAVCQTHNTVQKLQKAIEAAKKQPDGPNKSAKIEHLKHDIDGYERELREMKATLEEK